MLLLRTLNQGREGVAEDERSKRSAEKLALSRCGSPLCRLVSRTRNSCQAAAWGNGWAAVGGGGSEKIAEDEALSKCRSKGAVCKIEYVGCSFPVRVK